MSRRKENTFADRIVKYPFRYITSGALGTGVSQQFMNADSFGTRLASVADTFDLYRIVRLRYRLLPNSTRTVLQQAAWYPGIVDVQPSGIIEISTNMTGVALGSSQTVPTSWMNVSPSTLKGYSVWYKSRIGTPETSEELQGTIYITGTGSETYTLELEALFEFKNALAPANAPELRDKRERDRILKLLALPTTPSPVGVDTQQRLTLPRQ